MRSAVIASSSLYAPSRVLTNQYFNEMLGEDVGTWLEQNLTIRERRWAQANESTADLVENAAKDALHKAELSAEKIDLIIVATDTPEYISPSTASVVQYRLGAKNAGTFDLNTACAGFVTALDVASKYIASDEHYQNILVIGAYTMSKYLDLHDKKTVTLFADGAGGFVLSSEANSKRGFLSSQLLTEGQYHGWMGIYGGGTHLPTTTETLDKKDHLLKFVKKFPKELNPEIWSQMIQTLCSRVNIQPSDVAQYFFSQININSIWDTLGKLNLPKEKAHTIMDRYAYTGSACIPMAFHEAVELGKVKRGDLVMFVGSGGGLSFASAAFRY
ncbi:MAG: ketoacyl-ACP synthase III [Chloroherpetonaceae bacterium]|nr:ketoacyl-ACP synthase III [Chloroherpetonaceae bacterium]